MKRVHGASETEASRANEREEIERIKGVRCGWM